MAERPADSLVADDGRTLWASPTAGGPINPSALPAGTDLIVSLRPGRLLANEEGRRVWRALGPAAEAARRAIELAAGAPLEQVDHVLIGVGAGASYAEPRVTLRVGPAPRGEAPPLRREIEALLASSDADRAVTLLFAPGFLLGDGGALVEGRWAPLRDLLSHETNDSQRAVSLSVDPGDRADGPLYWELRVAPGVETPATEAARGLARQAAAWPDRLAVTLDAHAPSPHAAVLLERLPDMARVLARYARRGVEGRQAVVNGYLPPGAGHNLLLAAELLTAELLSGDPAGATPPSAATPAAGPAGLSLADRLAQSVTVSFRRESLVTALTILSDALRIPITIAGRDLQLEGITRNQLLTLDVTETPGESALVALLRQANPDPLATQPNDPRQKLVFVVRGDGLVITTRSAATERGEPLPPIFLP